MKVKTPEGDILEMSVISRDWVSDGEFADLPVLGSKVWSVSCVVGGHIQSIVGTECSSIESAVCALRDLAGDLSSGEGELGTTNGKPYVKRSWSLFLPAMENCDVRYMSGGEGELLGSNMSLADAQALVRENADDMHPENAADLVIKEVKEIV